MDEKTYESVIRRQTMKFADADLQLTVKELELEQTRVELEQVKARLAELETDPDREPEEATG